MENKIVGKFKFDLENNKCGWIKDNGMVFEVPKEGSGSGKVAHQKGFQLEGETNQSHGINFSQTFSQGKVGVRVWYKKSLLDGSRNDYFKKVEKIGDDCEIELTEKDEMVKVFDKQKDKDKWVNKSENH